MGSLHETNPSLWVGTSPETAYPHLSGDLHVEVAVIGAGIAGLSTALFLQQGGANVALIEAGRTASGVTGYTTAKVSSLHGLKYAQIRKTFGVERAAMYAEANQVAIDRMEHLAETLAPDCAFTRAPNFTYTEAADRQRDIEDEVDAARAAGLPASFTTDTDLPYPVAAAVRVENQAHFHARTYCLGLVRGFEDAGGHVFELTRAVDVDEGDPCTVTTEHGRVMAQHVVFATHLPFSDRGGFFAKTHPERSYALAAGLEGNVPEGMYLSADSPTRSVRPAVAGGETYVILGGEGHKTGQDDDTTDRYEALEAWSRERFDVRSIDYRWSAQDYVPVDHVPYIGRLTSHTERLHVATGFQKWGMTTGTVAGLIIAGDILGTPSEWAPAFDATRIEPGRSAGDLVKENLNVAKRFFGDRIGALFGERADELGPGEGGIVSKEGHRVAAYRDEDGTIRAVSARCTHLGCLVSFNTAEKSWDCPCHGSRFDLDGKVIQGPAVRDLDPVD
jgi:glycine/D-amino acid oxidase-like deaminating enzyme/nitrite reductase/ring-hydroxylating ferredoxin subunit